MKINKLKLQDEFIYPSTIIDAVKDASKTIVIDGKTVSNPSYGKTLREIILDNEEVSAAALNDLDLRISSIENANFGKLIEDIVKSAFVVEDTDDTTEYEDVF